MTPTGVAAEEEAAAAEETEGTREEADEATPILERTGGLEEELVA